MANAVSTSNTLETAQTKANGETESITATIGEHGEAPGTYRYALFGITDVYCLYEVDPATRAVRNIDYTTSARTSSYLWGIDFDPSGQDFGKTGDGDLIEIPAIDFINIAAPTDILEGPPVPPPPETKVTTLFWETGEQKAQGPDGGCTAIQGDTGIGTSASSRTDWEFEVKNVELLNPSNGEYQTIRATFVYYAKEMQGDRTILKFEKTLTKSLSDLRVIGFQADSPPTETWEGTILSYVPDVEKEVRNVYSGLVRNLKVVVDTNKGHEDWYIYFKATIAVDLIEKNR